MESIVDSGWEVVLPSSYLGFLIVANHRAQLDQCARRRHAVVLYAD